MTYHFISIRTANKNPDIPNSVKMRTNRHFMYFQRQCKLAGIFQKITWQYVEMIKMLMVYELAALLGYTIYEGQNVHKDSLQCCC